jgi:hypothetical protein
MGVELIPIGVELIPMGVELIDTPLWCPTTTASSARKPEKKPKKAKRKSIHPPLSTPDRCAFLLPFTY